MDDIIDLLVLDMLTKDGVSILKRKCIKYEETGELLQLGQDWRRAYVNSASGREQLSNEVPEPYLTSVLSVWGDTPTVNDTNLN